MEDYINLYPEIQQAGGLPHALDAEFIKSGLDIRTLPENPKDGFLVTWAFVRQGNKVLEVNIMTHKRRYVASFWRNGVCLAHSSTPHLDLFAAAADYWLTHNITTQQLAEKYPFVTPENKAQAFDEGRDVAYAWQNLNPIILEKLAPFVALAAKDEVVSTLFPFTSLYTLCLSRCTGYPYDDMGLPEVTPAQFAWFEDGRMKMGSAGGREGRFIVSRNRSEYLGEGTPTEALAIVRANLPPDVQPAVPGTAGDL